MKFSAIVTLSCLAAVLSLAAPLRAQVTTPDDILQRAGDPGDLGILRHPDVPSYPMSAEMLALARQAWQAYRAGRLLEVPDLLDTALRKAREQKDRVGELLCLYAESQVYSKAGLPGRAKQLEAEAQRIGEAASRADEGRALELMARLALESDNGALRKPYAERAVAAWRAAGDHRGEASALIALADVDADHARELLQQARVLAQAAGDPRTEARVLLHLCTISNGPTSAERLAGSRQAAALYHQAGDMAGEGWALWRVGDVYAAAGDPARALELYSKAQDLAQRSGDVLDEAVAVQRAALQLRALGRSREAVPRLERALALWTAIGRPIDQAQLWCALGDVHRDLGELSQAEACYLRVAQLPPTLTMYDESAKAGLAAVRLRQGAAQEALDAVTPVLVLMEGWPLPETVAAEAEEALGHLPAAAQHWKALAAFHERDRDFMGGLTDAKQSYLAANLGDYHAYISLLLRQGQVDDAFAWAEHTKGRALLDLMASGGAALGELATPAERAGQDDLDRRGARLNNELVAAELRDPAGAAVAQLKNQMAKLEDERRGFEDALYAAHPKLSTMRAARTLEARQLADVLPSGTALLDYVCLQIHRINGTVEDRTVLFCAVRERDDVAVRAYPIAKTRDELNEMVEDFRDSCSDPQRSYRGKAHDLYDLLLAPAAAQLAGQTRLLVCPDGPLWGVPFQALLVPRTAAGDNGAADQFLAQRYEVDYAYSASAVYQAFEARTAAGRKTPGGTLLALANPDFGGPARLGGATDASSQDATSDDATGRGLIARSRAIIARSRAVGRTGAILPLPGTQREADALHRLFPDALLLTGVAAQEAAVKQQAGGYRYLHLATHGLFNDVAPLLSSIVLAQPPAGSPEDGFLTAREIFNLDLHADLVVLSACDSGRGAQRSGEGVVGLCWALSAAGVPAQVVSQWAVSDDSTALLMQRFYERLRQGDGPGAALRQASQQLLGDGQHGHPYYWAPFVLLGDWRDPATVAAQNLAVRTGTAPRG